MKEQSKLKDLEDKAFFLEEIIAKMPGHIYWTDKNNVFLGCNDLQAKDAGLKSRKTIHGRTNYDMPWKQQADSLNKINNTVMKTGQSITAEETSTLANKKTAVFLSEKIPLRDKNNEIIGTLGISIDISEQKQLQKQVQQAEVKAKLQDEKIQGMKAIAASMAHELRTPLSAISNYSSIDNLFSDLITTYEIAKNAKLEIPIIRTTHLEAIHESMDSIKKEAAYASTIIDMLLVTLRELETANKNFSVQSIAECISDAIKRYPFNSQKQTDLVTATLENDFIFKGQPLLITHVLFNLIKNALYFLQKAQKGRIYIWLEKGRKYNKLYFKDTGTGIAKQDLPHIFDHFFSKTNNGTGIGLTFCKMVMQNIGGDVVCDSQKGKYTLFTLSFPRKI